jgi:hypothetical protein
MTIRPVIIATLAGGLAAATSLAQTPGRVPLDHGAYGVGFTVVEALDSTRAFRPLRDSRGRLHAENARPVQVYVWYPPRASPDAAGITPGEFRLLAEREVDFARRISPDDSARLRMEFIERTAGFGQSRDVAQQLWDERTRAVRGAPALTGPFPVVLYFTAAGVINPLMPAYLASHGFVVASFPSNGRMTEVSLAYSPNALTLDTDIDDAGFVHALLRRLPNADTRRLAVMSFSGGSLAALLWQMRDMQASAIVSVEGWERYRLGADLLARSVHYDPNRVRVPMLLIERAASETSPNFAKVPDVVDSLRHARRVRLAFRDAAHADFLSHAPFGSTDDHARIYQSSARTMRLFLQSVLESDTAARRAFADVTPPSADPFFGVRRDSAVAAVPTEEEFFRLAELDPDAAAEAYAEAIRVVPGHTLFREAVLTRAALFAAPAPRAAIMRIVVLAYPRSTAAHLTLGTALAEAGRPVEARDALQTALGLLTADPAIAEADQGAWRRRIDEALSNIPPP